MKTKNTRKGFTTVELVIVIAVIAILATVLIPTFSNMIEKANLSVDTQNVRNMNVCLATYITAGDPEDFGTVKARLKEFGYGKDDNFVAKTKGHTIRWYAEKNVILLVDENGAVVYPKEHINLPDVNDVYKCFDLSLPAATVINTGSQNIEAVDLYGDGSAVNLNLAVSYTFKAGEEPSTNYHNWIADFYVTYIVPENAGAHDLVLAGSYPNYENGKWFSLKNTSGQSIEALPLLYAMSGGNWQFEYSQIRDAVGTFNCGVEDAPGGANEGAELRVELRLTNPEDGTDFVVIGVYNYTFQ